MRRDRRFQALAIAGLALALASSSLAQVRPGGGGFSGGARPGGSEDDALLIHVLNRTSYGPTARSLQEIRTLGVDEYLHRQLHPEILNDSAVEAKLAGEVPTPLDPTYHWKHFYYEHVVRAAYSERQLQELMTQFWENHFDTVVPYGNNDTEIHAWTNLEERENAMWRRHALGRFRDLLEYSAKSQAMMYFLDNYTNSVGNGNENYARELLELHSLGVDCGYDQVDVQEVARIWTGWTGIYLVRNPSDPTLVKEDIDGDGVDDFVFNRRAHDASAKRALGQDFPAGGMVEEGERVLDIVSAHPCTARFVGRKLIELFVTDNPSEQLVDHVANVFLESDGNIRRVLEAIFATPEFRDPANFRGKVKTPLENTISVFRAVEGTIQPGQRRDGDYFALWYEISNQGMPLFQMAIPTGYAERGPAWISSNGFLKRWKFTDRIMNSSPSATAVYYSDPMAIVNRLRLSDTNAVIDHFTRVLIGTTVGDDRRPRLREILTGSPTGTFNAADGRQNARLREMCEQVLGFPEFIKQ